MSAIRPYLELSRVHKPAGGFFFLWPMVWGLAMAAYAERTPFIDLAWLMVKSIFGALILRSSACTVNDIFDRKYDAAVERTKNRPIASGRVSVFSASVFLLAQFAIGALFFATYNTYVFWLAMAKMVPLMCIYPLIKRFSYWPQAWLGVAINVGFAVSWYQISSTSSIQQGVPHVVSLMLLGTWCWTMMYDTVYGCQDKKDDIKVGVWSSSLFFGDYVWSVSVVLDTLFVACLYLAGVVNGHGLPYFAISVAGTAVQFIYQLATLDTNSEKSCWSNFKSNAFYLGPVIFTGIMMDYVRRKEFESVVAV